MNLHDQIIVMCVVLQTQGYWTKNAQTAPLIMETEWESFKTTYNKSYSSDENRLRFTRWRENLKKIERHNAEAYAGYHSYRLAMNHLGDMSTEEINRLLGGLLVSTNSSTSPDMELTYKPRDVSIPAEIDWRRHGYVTPVKFQGHCGACYTFATTGALEGQHFRSTGRLVSLSEQNLLDCTAAYGNHGCIGGLMDNAYRYIIQNGGVDTEAAYPYQAQVETCKYRPKAKGASCTGFRDLPKGSEEALQEAVATIGPVSVGIDAHSFSFYFYSEGVYDNPRCSSVHLTHGVLVVGYGSEEGHDFWLVKNSWGAFWGEDGYIRMARNRHNQCGIASLASYPLV